METAQKLTLCTQADVKQWKNVVKFGNDAGDTDSKYIIVRHYISLIII